MIILHFLCYASFSQELERQATDYQAWLLHLSRLINLVCLKLKRNPVFIIGDKSSKREAYVALWGSRWAGEAGGSRANQLTSNNNTPLPFPFTWDGPAVPLMAAWGGLLNATQQPQEQPNCHLTKCHKAWGRGEVTAGIGRGTQRGLERNR